MVRQLLENMSRFSLFRFFADGDQVGMYIHVYYDPTIMGTHQAYFCSIHQCTSAAGSTDATIGLLSAELRRRLHNRKHVGAKVQACNK